ncbi:DUF6894 family protein [Bradyrhizobium sp.]|jgi:hypothetical protein|uniref:DUF6894 family protein n=1 Tax=Bradyrhizobium sp. TaxID=376 RepID=UPI003C1A0206
MQTYSFSVKEGKFSNTPVTSRLPDLAAAQKEAIGLCADLMPDVLREVDSDCNWQIEVSDQAGTPVYRLRLVAEPLA